MTKNEFIEALKSNFLSVFPNGYCQVSDRHLGGGTLSVHIGLIGNLEHCSMRIRQNDPMHLIMMIHDAFDPETGLMRDEVAIECSGARISVNPPKDSYYAMGSVKLGFRKIRNTPIKALKSYAKFCKKAHGIVKSEYQNIYGLSGIRGEYLDCLS